MLCPACGNISSRVVDSRPAPDGDAIRRRRACERCGERFTTWERVEEVVPLVVKRDGRREPFQRDKIRHSVSIAIRKRPVPADEVERIVSRVSDEVTRSVGSELPSEDIGELVLSQLAAVDEVAYARFASVYLRFESLEDFRDLVAPSSKPPEP
ncbi:MAG: transcriptional repressor NrdR [Deltaproteobacteria bacterium]|nr:transcriptional repressor NrdR [Deltaproteobacteria bacterium]